MKKRISLVLVILLLGSMLFAQVALAAPGDQIRVEFRYTTVAPTIPTNIVRTGLPYVLLETSEPVIEFARPLIREVSEDIVGYVKEADLPLYRNLEGVRITPVDFTLLKEDDVMETVHGLPTNDVEDLPESLQEFARAGVRFEVEKEDEFGLPTSYTAFIYFRGLIQDKTTAYYKVERTLIHEETYGYENNYLVVAIYEEQAVTDDTATADETDLETLGGGEVPLNYADIPDQAERNRRALEELDSDNMPIMQLGDMDVPLVSFPHHDSWAVANVILTIVSLAFVLVYAFSPEEKKTKDHRTFETRYIGMILGGASIVMFFVTQQIKGIAVVFDVWSVVFAGIVVVQVVLHVLSRKRVVEVR